MTHTHTHTHTVPCTPCMRTFMAFVDKVRHTHAHTHTHTPCIHYEKQFGTACACTTCMTIITRWDMHDPQTITSGLHALLATTRALYAAKYAVWLHEYVCNACVCVCVCVCVK